MTKLKKRTAIIISVSSDIGSALARRWRANGWSVLGTYRTHSPVVEELRALGVGLVRCDLSSPSAVRRACRTLKKKSSRWDALVMCTGTQEPVGLLQECDFDEWEASVRVNFTSQVRIVQALLPARRVPVSRKDLGPCVLFFAGGGTNDGRTHYSAYIVSKIALIKVTELLDNEVPDTRFAILGPGWVRTKIHEGTLRAGKRAGPNYERTLKRMATDDFVPMDDVLRCCDWIVDSPRQVVGGRNFSVVFDCWGSASLRKLLKSEPNLYRLRRFGNNRLIKC